MEKGRARKIHHDKRVVESRAKFVRDLYQGKVENLGKKFKGGYLKKKHPFDCGVPGCDCCHLDKKQPRRTREKRAVRKDVLGELGEEE